MHSIRRLSRRQIGSSVVTRRLVLGAAAAVVATPALAEECHIGPPDHAQGPRIWLDMDQVELDAAYDQSVYAPLGNQIRARFASTSEQVRARVGAPQRLTYGPSEFERLDLYRTKRPKAPIFVYFHGGARRPTCSPRTRPGGWRSTSPSCRSCCGNNERAEETVVS